MKSFALLFLGFAIALSAQPLDMTTPMHGEVVYRENFDKTATLDGFTLFESKQWKIENGKLVHPITGGMPQLLLPKATFGQDMAIQADVTILQAANETRWAGIFLRHLEDKAVFTHMPVRYNRSTEIADAVIDENKHFNWRVYAPTFKRDGKPATATRTHRLEIRGNIARAFIDGKCVRFAFVDSSSVHPGRAGFSLSAVQVEIDNIVVEKLPPVSQKEKIAISKMYTSMPFVIAHRGFSERFPENTLEAIRGALEAGADVVIGSRFLRESDLAQVPKGKRLVLRCARIVNGVFTGMWLTDAHNGFRALGRKALEAIDLTENRMAHATEIMSQIRAAKLTVKEVPVTIRYTDYSQAKGQKWTNSLNILIDLILNKIM